MATDLRSVPLFGSGVYGKSAVVTRQRRLNCYYELRQDGDKGAKVVIYGTPGTVLKYTLANPLGLPARALLGNQSHLYAVVYNQFQDLVGGVAQFNGTIGSQAGLASIALNPSGSQVCIVDGVGGWVYQPGVPSFLPMPTSSWFYPGAKTITNVGGYFVIDIPGTNQFGVSNINDATAGSGLSFGAASAYPDLVVAVDNLDGNLIVFSQTHTEPWQNVGNPPPGQPFIPIQSAIARYGLAALFSRGQVDDSLIFLGVTAQGTKRVVQIRGYTFTPISAEIDWIINQPGFVTSDAVALTYQRDVHPFYQLTFPTMGRSFLFDCSTGIFNETQTGLTANYAARHVGNLSTTVDGDTLISDWESSNLYRFDDSTYTDNGVTILREIITRTSFKGGNRFRVPQLYLDMETGVGLPGIPGAPGTDPLMSVECSKDNGRSWLLPRLVRVGKISEFIARMNVRRFGRARQFTWRFRFNEPCKFVIVDGAIKVRGLKAA